MLTTYTPRTATSDSHATDPINPFDRSEWGPANHNPDNPTSVEATRAALEDREFLGERPDDN